MRGFIVIFALALGLGGAMVANQWAEQRRYHRMFGPNPATVKFECDDGCNGTILVRDFNNAESEIVAHVESVRKSVGEIPGFEIQGSWQPVKVTKIEKVVSP